MDATIVEQVSLAIWASGCKYLFFLQLRSLSIQPSHCVATPLMTAQSGRSMDFTFTSMEDKNMLPVHPDVYGTH